MKSVEDYIQVLLDGNTISYYDLEITDLTSKVSPKSRIQVYKRKRRVLDKNGKATTKEYNTIHYNYQDAVKDFLRLRAEN